MANRIDIKLAQVRASGRPALVPWVTVGYPDIETSEALAEAIVDAGADMLEMGVPFSDPLADGPTIQAASQRALEHGVNIDTALEVLRHLREKGIETPLIFMGYLNPVIHYGTKRFAENASAAGLDGIIIPDLPSDEAGPYKDTLEEKGIYLIPLLAPTSTDERIAEACKAAKGFIYCVSLSGVTGARSEVSADTSGLVRRIRQHTDLPVLVGFGVSLRRHVEQIGEYADGAVVASALLNAIDAAPPDKVLEVAGEFVRGLIPT